MYHHRFLVTSNQPHRDMSSREKKTNEICKNIPNLISSFVDTFVAYSFSGIFRPHDPTPPPNSIPQTRFESPDLLVAIGDLHGDLEKSKEAFRIAGLIYSSDQWIGGSTMVVQVGDVFDRGGEELKILYFLERLKCEAERSGGKVVTMNGNHEIMNVEGDLYVTKKGLEEVQVWLDWYCLGNKMKSLCQGLEKVKDPYEGVPTSFPRAKPECFEGIRARTAALRPQGPVAKRFLARNQTVAVVGDSVFVHGGLLAEHIEYGLERINEEVRDWINGLSGRGRYALGYCRGGNSVVWLRRFFDERSHKCDCAALEHALSTIPGVKRMIMGHTIQDSGINDVCDNKVIMIDVGMSKGCSNGLPEVLEIRKDSGVWIVTSNPLYKEKSDSKMGLDLLVPAEHAPKQLEVKALSDLN